ncbi:MBL fold metallo-hydrolase, partial [Anaerococcus sp.]
YYGKVNLLAVIANFLILPLFTISMYAIFIAIISYPLLKIVLLPVFKLIDYLLASILNLTSILNSISIFAFEFAHPNILVSLYLYVLIVVMLYMKKSNKILLKHFYIVNIFVVIISLLYESVNNEISYSMIDIGQGDAFLINDGGDYYLIDVGGPKYDSYDSGEKILVPYLKSLGIKEINAVFISHEDNDHCGNLPILYNNFKINNLITGPYNTDGLREYHPIAMHKNNRMKLKNGYIECIFEGSMGEENAESLGLLVNIKGVKILSMGDLPKEYEDTLDIKADVLKISHHGSKTSTSKSFVEKVNPKVALISAGRNNRYGHPTKEVLDNLEGVKIYNSQESGMVKIVFGNSTKIESYLKGGYFK